MHNYNFYVDIKMPQSTVRYFACNMHRKKRYMSKNVRKHFAKALASEPLISLRKIMCTLNSFIACNEDESKKAMTAKSGFY